MEQKSSLKWLRVFIPIWAGQVFSLLGSGLVHFALIWWMTEKTGSAAVLASASLVGLLPQVFLSPFAGALVDRWNRRWVMVAADGTVALATVGLVILFASGQVQLWHVYVALFIRSLGGAFHWPAMQASTSLMVPKEHLSRIAGANQALNGLIGIGAPPLGALLMSTLPIFQVLAVDIVTAGLAILPLLFIAIPQPVREDAHLAVTPKTVWADVRGGFRYVVSWPGVFTLLLMAAMVNFLLSPGSAFMPLLVTQHFKGGALQLAWMQSAWGVGVVAGGLLLSAWGGFRRKIITSMLSLMGIGVGVLLTGAAPAWGYWIAWSGMLISGIMNPLTNGPLFALLQSKIEPHMQGRVFTLVNSLASAMMPLGMMIGAPVAEWLGLRSWYLFGGVMCLLMGFIGLTAPLINTLDDQQPGGKRIVPAAEPTISTD
ncbi:MFS transporter [Bellilinea sp.]|uniref:MFS transporter n=1 Tax=Bellilinea sp. TaxID=2838785 RepID=UPI002ADDC3CD|nr:MFS transporter [Bellilinea sp.]